MENKDQVVQEIEGYLKKAKKAYGRAQYSEALTIYNDCLEFIDDMKKENLNLFSLQLEVISLRGLAQMVLGDSKSSLVDFNHVLDKREFDIATLRRRAKLYMKVKRSINKIGSLQKAFQDIEYVLSMQPDVDLNFLLDDFQTLLDQSQESDMKYQIKKRIGQLRAEDDEEEQVLLGFCNLRTIDRKSVISVPHKKESVYFGQDEIYSIEKKQETEKVDKLTLEQTMKKLEDQQIELKTNPQINSEEENIKVVLNTSASNHTSKKSILKKNSVSSAFKSSESAPSLKAETNESRISATSIKDIEGKVIAKNKSEIKFRKSEFYYGNAHGNEDKNASCRVNSRKSILKNRASDINHLPINYDNRKSSFLNIKNIEGKLLQLADSHFSQEQEPKQSSASSIESDEEFNIYGKKISPLTNEDCQRLAMKLAGTEENEKPKGWHSVGEAQCNRKSVLKPKNSIYAKKPEQRRTVNFKQ